MYFILLYFIRQYLKENYKYVRIWNYKKDWALFREKVADWQEAYMDKLNKEYIDLLNGDGRPSEKFWALEERIRNDKKDTGVQLRMSRSNCIYNIASLLNEGAITMEDLEEFSDELKERVRFIAK